ncbi:MAG: DUF4926 domain-containing protein [Planctomycetia bacterium]|nr:DUF4926 domain-containing protein [Planctomycetia bacterium]
MIEELDTVVLTKDIPASGLQAGDVGAVVHHYPGSTSFEVEFVAADGRTIALLTLSQDEIRTRKASEILHVRDLASA